jgi:hypothetical protein
MRRPPHRVIWVFALLGCKAPFAHYCDESTPCTDPARPFCDLSGEFAASGGHGRVCIPTPSDAELGDGGGVDAPSHDGNTYDARSPTLPEPPILLAPVNGALTGSHLVAVSRRPEFRWSPSAGADRYEITIDDMCLVASFTSCDFPSPERTDSTLTGTRWTPPAPLPVETVMRPFGRRYFWRLRACNAAGCSAWSPVRYVDVGRQATDYNGDGYGDLVVGASRDGDGRR